MRVTFSRLRYKAQTIILQTKHKQMKKLLLVLAIGVAVVSCNNSTETTATTPVENTDSLAKAATADSLAKVAADSAAAAHAADSTAAAAKAAADSAAAKAAADSAAAKAKKK